MPPLFAVFVIRIDLALADFFSALRGDFLAADFFVGDLVGVLLAAFAVLRPATFLAARFLRREGCVAIGGASIGSDTRPSAANGI